MGTLEGIWGVAHVAQYRMRQLDFQNESSSEEEYSPPKPPVAKEFKEAQSASKYLFDGVNLIHIIPTKMFKKKAIYGKAAAMHETIKRRLDETKFGCRRKMKSAFAGDLEDYIPKENYLGIPAVLYYCAREIERRTPYEKEYVYMPRFNEELRVQEKKEVKKLKKAFLKGERPDVRDAFNQSHMIMFSLQ